MDGPQRKRSHELDLDRARVLELVDEQVVEALAQGLGDRAVAAQQIERDELQMVEVDTGARRAQLLVAVSVGDEQAPQSAVGVARLLELGRGRLGVAVGRRELDRGELGAPFTAVAEVGVGGSDDPAEAPPVVRRDRDDPGVGGPELRERRLVRLARQPGGASSASRTRKRGSRPAATGWVASRRLR